MSISAQRILDCKRSITALFNYKDFLKTDCTLAQLSNANLRRPQRGRLGRRGRPRGGLGGAGSAAPAGATPASSALPYKAPKYSCYEAVAEWSRRTYPAPLGAGGVGSIPGNSDALNVPSFRRWRFGMKLSPCYCFVFDLACISGTKNVQHSGGHSGGPAGCHMEQNWARQDEQACSSHKRSCTEYKSRK